MMNYKNAFVLGLLLSGSILTSTINAQYCDATSKGAGNIFGGNVTSIEILDDSGLIYGYYGIANNTSQIILNPSSQFTLSSWEYFTMSLKGTADSTGKKWWTKVGVWVDLNGDDSFSAQECIADPVTGPYTHLLKDSWVTGLLKIPGVVKPGKTRMRIRGFESASSPQNTMGCGSSNAYGNQVDMLINLFEGPMDIGIPQYGHTRIYPNPASNEVNIFSKAEIQSKVVVWDMAGKLVLEQQASGKNMQVLDISGLKCGAYYVSYTAGNIKITQQLYINH